MYVKGRETERNEMTIRETLPYLWMLDRLMDGERTEDPCEALEALLSDRAIFGDRALPDVSEDWNGPRADAWMRICEMAYDQFVDDNWSDYHY